MDDTLILATNEVALSRMTWTLESFQTAYGMEQTGITDKTVAFILGTRKSPITTDRTFLSTPTNLPKTQSKTVRPR